jgi:transposase
LAVHGDGIVRDQLHAQGVGLEFLPPYSPELQAAVSLALPG